MDEAFLHHIWKYQLFEHKILTAGQKLKVFYPGDHNLDSGPDFKEARLKIDSIEWAGQVEIHVKSSDWLHHNHQLNQAYDNVILHVVWNHDKEIEVNGSTIPVLELKDKVELRLIDKYKNHLRSKEAILCQSQLADVNPIQTSNMIDRVLVERLEEKARLILTDLTNTKNDWEEMVYRMIVANFGFSTNKDAFIRLSEVLPFRKLKKNLDSLKSTEALLFGQAGFLEKSIDQYQESLRDEHTYLSKKHELHEPMISVQWKLGKLRPPNFPTVRLSQLAALLHHYPKLFSLLIENQDVKKLKEIFSISVSDYWNEHYDFSKKKKKQSNGIGEKSVEILLINVVAPILAAYSTFTDEQKFMDRAILLLESIKFEDNRMTRMFDMSYFPSKTSFDSQALIHLQKNYCQRKRCLNCHIGVQLISK